VCPSLIQIGSKTAEKNSAQTNRQTNRQTDKQTNRHYENNGHLAVNQKCVLANISLPIEPTPAPKYLPTEPGWGPKHVRTRPDDNSSWDTYIVADTQWRCMDQQQMELFGRPSLPAATILLSCMFPRYHRCFTIRDCLWHWTVFHLGYNSWNYGPCKIYYSLVNTF